MYPPALQISLHNPGDLAQAIQAGITTLERLSAWARRPINDQGLLVVDPGVIYVDGGVAEKSYRGLTHAEAARRYVRDDRECREARAHDRRAGRYSLVPIEDAADPQSVRTYHYALDAHGRWHRVDIQAHSVALIQ